jgi:hypothetical protein
VVRRVLAALAVEECHAVAAVVAAEAAEDAAVAADVEDDVKRR